MLALVIDDSRAMRMLLRRSLEQLNINVIEATNGQDALRVLRELPAPPDLALVDWNMPEMDGLEFLKAVQAEPAWQDMTVMMVSSEGRQGRIMQALTSGADEYLVKPLGPNAVGQKLWRHGLHPGNVRAPEAATAA